MSEKIKAYEVDLTELRPDPGNANKGSERGQYMLDASLAKTGLHRGVAVDANGYLVAGNKTHQAAIDAGFTRAIVVETDGNTLVVTKRNDFDLLDDAPNNKAREAAYYDNRSSEVSLTWDAEQLMADLQAGLPLDDFWRQDELDELLAELMPKPEAADVGPQIDKAAELAEKWGTKTRQCWQIGAHRLIVGDCTDAAVVARVMGGEKADCVVTDPPYGIGADKSMHEKGGQQYGKAAAPKRHYAESDWDSEPPEQEVIDRIVSLAPRIVIWGGNYFNLPPARCYLVWDKQNDGNQFADCELAWTNLDKPVRLIRHLWNGMLREGKEERNSHPTQKPLEVMIWAINQTGDGCNIILDPFAGSGTTGIACAQLGRKARMIEIDPGYCAVILERMATATHITPTLMES